MAEETEEKPTRPPLYADREEWKDIKPLEQSDLTQPLVPIFYPQEYKDATDYFRGIVAIGEHSERVLELTEHIIRMNPAHYSVWQYRYDTLIALNSSLEKELQLIDELALKHLKFYQVWHHRKLLMIQLKTPLPELTYLSKVLTHDVKNYHTWAYRQWLLTHFDDEKLWAQELPFVDLLLMEDVRNNSAWHHRFFVVWDAGVREGEEDREQVLRRELSYVKEKIAMAPNNLSAWNYLRGILDKNKKPYGDTELDLETFVVPYTVGRESTEQKAVDDEVLIDLDNPAPSSTAGLPCPLAMEFLADIYVRRLKESTIEPDKRGSIAGAAEKLFTDLAEKHDTTRRKYWDYRKKQISI